MLLLNTAGRMQKSVQVEASFVHYSAYKRYILNV